MLYCELLRDNMLNEILKREQLHIMNWKELHFLSKCSFLPIKVRLKFDKTKGYYFQQGKILKILVIEFFNAFNVLVYFLML